MTVPLKDCLIIITCTLFFAFIIFLITFLIIEIILNNKELEESAEEKNIKDLVKKFHKKLDKVSNQETNEILECLKEMEELDNIYYIMIENNYKIIEEETYIKEKNNILDKIITKKYKSIKNNKKEKYKALLDELNVCQKRYPLYKNTYFNHINNIKEKI